MKKLLSLFYGLLCITAISCMHSDHDINITLNESDRYYSMKAYFSKNKTRDVERYMDSRIGKRSNMSFVNSQIDGRLALDDHTTFYIKKSPGLLKIKFDKAENSEEAYERIRSMCEGIKNVLAN